MLKYTSAMVDLALTGLILVVGYSSWQVLRNYRSDREAWLRFVDDHDLADLPVEED